MRRHSSTRFAHLIFGVYLLLAMTPLSAAAQMREDWAAVMALAAGQQVKVAATRHVRGVVERVDAQRLVIIDSGRSVEFSRPEVRSVVTIGERPVRRHARNGLIFGAAAGATMGALLADTNKAQWAMVIGAGWAAIGAAIGATDGLSRTETEIYRRRRSS
jgi:hypothetical protein